MVRSPEGRRLPPWYDGWGGRIVLKGKLKGHQVTFKGQRVALGWVMWLL